MAHLKTKTLVMAALLEITAVASACLPVKAQSVYSCSNGAVSFFSEAPLENIKAESGSMHSMLNTATGEVVFIVPVRTFRFKKALMKEHFNERYLESHKYPQAVYKGKINETIDLQKDGEFRVTAHGTLTIHNVGQQRTDTAKLVIAGGSILLQADFRVTLADHDIEIPRIVFQNIAEVVDVSFKAAYTPYQSKK